MRHPVEFHSLFTKVVRKDRQHPKRGKVLDAMPIDN